MPHKFTQSECESAFLANPILCDFISCALQDAQLTEADEACMEQRDKRDSGTIYTLPAETFLKLQTIAARFAVECFEHIESATDLEPGDDGFRYAKEYMTHSRIGSTLWLAVTGSGVTFTDDGSAPCLIAMADWANGLHVESLYFGDDGEMYLMGN